MNLKNGVRGVRPSEYGFGTDYADGLIYVFKPFGRVDGILRSLAYIVLYAVRMAYASTPLKGSAEGTAAPRSICLPNSPSGLELS